jgi:hypothetical protein
MVKKSASPGKTTTKRKAKSTAAATTDLADSAVITVLESTQSKMDPASIDPSVRRQLVAAEAYFRAERRGFAAGNELEDWIAAEAAVDSRLQQTRVA